jgi:hypothetical protein
VKFGLNYISSVCEEKRIEMATRSLSSLIKTNVEGLETPTLRISYKPSSFDYEPFVDELKKKFTVMLIPDPPHYNSMVYAATDSANALLNEDQSITHICHLCDDRLFNSEWLQQLKGLIERHAGARAWSVYRSATVEYHQIVGSDGLDVLMSMHDAIGCTTREEWQGFFSSCGFTPCPDIHHSQMRPGQRWATGRDYMQNMGLHFERDCAIDFVGE